MRQLATIQLVSEVQPIVNADAIEKIRVRDWWCVSKKGEFSAGDHCVYFEIDSLLPSSNPVFDFLSSGSRVVTIATETGTASGYRLKTVKLRGQISQGLALRPSAFGIDMPIGSDVTDAVGVVLWEPPISKQLATQMRGAFPSFIPKTDEERVQNLRTEIEARAGEKCYITEKLDGISATFFRVDGEFHACSRNWDTKEGNLYWAAAAKYGLVDGLPDGYAVQGEIIGEAVRGNPLGRKGQELYVFNVYDFHVGRALAFDELVKFCADRNLLMVPVINSDYSLEIDMPGLIAMAEGNSMLSPSAQREGIVIRPLASDGRLSFKSISNRYLLKEK